MKECKTPSKRIKASKIFNVRKMNIPDELKDKIVTDILINDIYWIKIIGEEEIRLDGIRKIGRILSNNPEKIGWGLYLDYNEKHDLYIQLRRDGKHQGCNHDHYNIDVTCSKKGVRGYPDPRINHVKENLYEKITMGLKDGSKYETKFRCSGVSGLGKINK